MTVAPGPVAPEGGRALAVDAHGIEVIPREECLRLLVSGHVARLAVVAGGQPLVFPINYTLAGEDVVFRTGAGTKLQALEGSSVAVQIDRVDEATLTGWSVLVQGHAEEITDRSAPEVAALRALPLEPWAPGPKEHWFRVRATTVSGRRVVGERHA